MHKSHLSDGCVNKWPYGGIKKTKCKKNGLVRNGMSLWKAKHFAKELKTWKPELVNGYQNTFKNPLNQENADVINSD